MSIYGENNSYKNWQFPRISLFNKNLFKLRRNASLPFNVTAVVALRGIYCVMVWRTVLMVQMKLFAPFYLNINQECSTSMHMVGVCFINEWNDVNPTIRSKKWSKIMATIVFDDSEKIRIFFYELSLQSASCRGERCVKKIHWKLKFKKK